MIKMIEVFDCGRPAVITEKTKLPKFALAKLAYSFGRGDKENSNRRTYPENIFVREINRKNEEIRKSKIVGQLEHPLGGTTQLDKAMHVISGLHYDPSTKLATAESLVLDTSGGRDFLTLLNSGVKMGVSMRGYGNVDKDGRVQTDYKLETLDFVLKPAFGADARIDQSNILESANDLFVTDENILDSETITSEIERVAELETNMYDMLKEFWRQDKSFSGSFDDYKERYEGTARKMMGIEKEEKDRLEGLKKSAPRKRVLTKDVFLEARLMGIPASEYAKKLNENIEKEEADESQKSLRGQLILAGVPHDQLDEKIKLFQENAVEKKSDPLLEQAKRVAQEKNIKVETALFLLKEIEEDKKKEEERVAELARINEQKHLSGANRQRGIKAAYKL